MAKLKRTDPRNWWMGTERNGQDIEQIYNLTQSKIKHGDKSGYYNNKMHF